MPGPYIFKQIFAADPFNTANVATNASILLFAPGDPAMTPLIITDASTGLTLANPVQTNTNGFGPTFAHATLDQVAWEGGGFKGTFESWRGLKDDAEASATSAATSALAAETAAEEAATAVQEALAGAVAEAEAAKVAAQAAAGLVGAPAGAAVLAAIQPGGAAHGELSAAFGPEAIGNPESEQSNAIQLLIDAALLGYRPEDVPIVVNHGDDANHARPVWPGPVIWQGTVTPVNRLDGDSYYLVVVEPLPWVPGDLGSALFAWWDPTQLALADGATVATLPDLSGNARNMTAELGAVTLSLTGMNGTPVLNFAGAMNLGVNAVRTPGYSVFLAFSVAGSAGSTQWIVGGRTADPFNRELFHRTNATTWGARGGESAVTGGTSNTAIHVAQITIRADGTVKIVIDGGTPITGSGGAANTLARITLGPAASSNQFTGKIGNTLIVNGEPDDASVTKILTFLRAKHGITV